MSVFNRTDIINPPVADDVEFDNSSNGFTSDEVQGAIEEIQQQAAVSASPGFTWGKGGSAGSGEYLNNDEVESNKSGRLVPFDGFVTTFFVNNEKTAGNKILELRRRRPCQTGPFVTIASITLLPGDACGSFPVNAAVLEGDELSVRVSNSSADFENPIVGIIIKNNSGQGIVGGSFLQTQDEGVEIEATTTSYNFTGSAVTATTDGVGNVTVDINVPGGAGEANTSSNVGGGAELALPKSGVDLPFRTMGDTGDITFTENGNVVEASLVNAPDLNVGLAAEAIDTAGGQTVTAGAAVTLNSFTSSTVATASAAGIEILVDGFYEVKYDCTLIGTTNSRSESETTLRLNTVTVPGTLRAGYHRNAAQNRNSMTATRYLQLSAGDDLEIFAVRANGGTVLQTVGNGSTISVKYLRSSN